MRGTTVANIHQIKIYNALHIKHDLLGTQKIKISLKTQKKEKADKYSVENLNKNRVNPLIKPML